MIETFHKPMNRRCFIKAGLAAAGAVVTIGAGDSFCANKNEKKATRWAFLSDTHIPADVENNYRGFYPYRNLRKVAADVISASPDGVAITGDLARLTGELGDYENLKKLLGPVAEKSPVFLALGNHDNRQNFIQVFIETLGEKQLVRGKHVVVAKRAPIRMIILDSLLYVNKVPGLLGKVQRQWLESYLKKSDETPTILCFHHTMGDGDGDLLDVPRLLDLVKPIRKVKAILYGHSHVYGFSRFKGIHLINLPAVGYNFSDTEPVGWIEANLTAEGGDFKLHASAGNTDNDGSVKKLTWRK
ncbi:MAG: metallophosphoesterase family protein [Planctomycetota bacterium]|jgi:3',5'-cyclic AMP phosphodiesterase CpdA